jgi:serine/threonine protein kinase
MLESTQRLTSQDVLSTNKRTGPEHRSSWGYISVDRKGEDNVPASQSEKLVRRRSSSFLAVQSALFELNYISDFDVVKIGEGFFAEVFKATHRATGEVMVLKMNKQTQNSKKMLDEIQLLNQLSHPNILKYRGCCVHEGQLHALTEFINGGSLEEILQDRSFALPWVMRGNIAHDISKGMAYLHSKGVFHRDLTSKNCLVQINSEVYTRTVVADFGLAAKFRKPSGEYHNEVVGTPYWMAPECLCGRPYCEQADIFSYGIILAELATRLSADPDFLPRTKVQN